MTDTQAKISDEQLKRWVYGYENCRHPNQCGWIAQEAIRHEAFGELCTELLAARESLKVCKEALEGVIAVADRKTVEFDRARAALEKLGER